MANPYGFSQTGIELLNAELAKRGINPAAASGAIAGIMGESGGNLDPTSFNSKDPGGGSGGIGQWNRGRLIGSNGMLAFAQNAGVPGIDVNTPTDAKKVPLAIQAQYLGHELDTTYAGVSKQLQTAQSPQDALNVWVNSYEDPADKAGAIKQRSQYLAPVGAAIAGGGGANTQAPGPIDPSIIAHGGTSPAIPGTTLNSPVASAVASAATPGVLPGFPNKAASDNFTSGATALDKAMHGGSSAAGGQEGGQGAFNFPQARNVSPLLGMSSQVYGNTLNSMATPLQWSSATPGQSPYAVGGPAPLGTGLNSLAQLKQMMAMYGGDPSGGGYG